VGTRFHRLLIDYGTYPEQPTPFFRQADPPIKLFNIHPGASKEPIITTGLTFLTGDLLTR
jgi:hypothetical protein